MQSDLNLPEYAELQCLSHYSFLLGASEPEQLVQRASQLGYSALALTDECSLAGVVKAHLEAVRCGLKLIIGSQLRITPQDGSAPFFLIALACNKNGYGNLSELITLARTRAEKGSYLLHPADLASPSGELAHLRGLPDCQLILVPDADAGPQLLARQAGWLLHLAAGRARMALSLHQRAGEAQRRSMIAALAAEFGLPLVACGDVCMHRRSYKPVQDCMTAIRLGRSLRDCGYDLFPNAERHLRSRARLGQLYPPAVLRETLLVADSCHFSLDQLRYEYPRELVPQGLTPTQYLRQETLAGAARRYPQQVPDKVLQLLEKELQLIAELDYESYFLTVYDIVRFARAQQILCQGRGSAANSAVCYCLGITEVNPAQSSLLFERFISKERNEPPDIDVDFEHQRREEVIQYIYRKYGRMRAALTAVVISYQPRSVVRDVGKALGVDLAIIEKVVQIRRGWGRHADVIGRLQECGLAHDTVLASQWHHLCEVMMRFPRHLSQHPGGFVISHDKLSRLVPIENAAMPERSVVQWDKDDLDAVGLLKIDILALGMLSCLRRALDLLSQQRGRRFSMADIPVEDSATYRMISNADTIGVFQIESRAQMSMLPRLRPQTFYDLVIEVAIIRPGPIQGGMIQPYLRRRQGLEKITYPSPAIEQVLERTLGVPVFQEQVMQIAMVAAGFSAGRADQLRRAMAAWKRKGNLQPYFEELRTGMTERGYLPQFAEAIISQIQGFAEYGFPESHAASFALLAYFSSWLKCHHPAVFLTALLNSQPMGFYSAATLVQDARRHGVTVLPADVRYSQWEAQLEDVQTAGNDTNTNTGAAVRLGMNQIRGLQQQAASRIVQARQQGDFCDVSELALRAALSRTDLQALAAADALQGLAGNRHQAAWQASASVQQYDLLQQTAVPELPLALPAPPEGRQILADYRHTGLSLRRHPLALLRSRLQQYRMLSASQLQQSSDRALLWACGLVTVRQQPGTAKGVVFVSLEDETGLVNVIVWPDLARENKQTLLQASLLAVYGRWQFQSGVRHLIAQRLIDLSGMLGELDIRSRDFH